MAISAVDIAIHDAKANWFAATQDRSAQSRDFGVVR